MDAQGASCASASSSPEGAVQVEAQRPLAALQQLHKLARDSDSAPVAGRSAQALTQKSRALAQLLLRQTLRTRYRFSLRSMASTAFITAGSSLRSRPSILRTALITVV